MGEPQEVEGGRTLAAPLPRRWTPERHQTRLVRMQGQAETSQPLPQHLHHAPGVVLTLETDDEVVAVADQGCPAPQPRLHLLFEPEVEST